MQKMHSMRKKEQKSPKKSKKSTKNKPEKAETGKGEPNPVGRPRIPNIKEKFNKACELYSLGVYTVDEACQQVGFCDSTFYSLLTDNPEFLEPYTRAQRIKLFRELDQADEILANSRNDYMERVKKDGESGIVFVPDNIRRSVERVVHIRWKAENLMRGTYGKKLDVEHSGKDGGPIQAVINFGTPPKE